MSITAILFPKRHTFKPHSQNTAGQIVSPALCAVKAESCYHANSPIRQQPWLVARALEPAVNIAPCRRCRTITCQSISAGVAVDTTTIKIGRR